MISKVKDYIASAPADIQATLQNLRKIIVGELPQCKEEFDRFPVYTHDGRWVAGFAWRKKGPMLYIMNSGLLDRYSNRLGKLRTGKSCIEYRASRQVTIAELQALALEMLAEAGKQL